MLNVLKLIFIEQALLAVLIKLTPGCGNEFNDCQNAKRRIAVLPIMEYKTPRNSTLKWLEWAYKLRDFTRRRLRNPKYNKYQPLFTIQDEWTILKYVMEVLKPIWCRTLLISKRHMVTLHHVSPVFNIMFNHVDGAMRAIAMKRSQ